MPRGSGLHSQLMAKRKELEKAIADIDAVIRLAGGKVGRSGRVRKPMSEEQKRKISEAATRRHAQNRAAKAKSHTHTRTNAKPKAINRPRPRPKQQQEDGMEAEA